jgi:NADH-quinone oxidoreductase subunit G
VNQYWMCDDGMLDYRRIHEQRVLIAQVDGEPTAREAALARAADLFAAAPPETTAVVLSAEHSLEDNFALLELARDGLKTQNVYFSGRAPGEGDNVLRDADKNPNTSGVRKLAPQAKPFADLVRAAEEGKLTHVLALGSQAPSDASALAKIRHLVAISAHEGPFEEHAEIVLPAASWAEAEGTFVNRQGMTQESERAVTPRGDSRPAFRWVHELRLALDRPPAWKKLGELRAAMQPPALPTGARP